MSRFVVCVSYMFVVWGLVYGISSAQTPLHLNLNPEKIQNAKKLEQEAITKKDSLLLAEAWYLYGKAYVFAGDYHTAQTYYLKSLRIHEPRGNSFELSRLYVRLSESEIRLGRLKQAMHYAELSLQVAQRSKIDKEQALIRAYGALGHIYETMWRASGKQSEFDTGLSYYIKRESLCRKINDMMGVAESSLELGTLFTQTKDPRAIPYLEKALRLFTINNKGVILVSTMIHLSDAYLTFNRPEESFQTLIEAESLYKRKKLNDYEIKVGLESQFVRYFESSQQWEKAFDHLRKLTDLERIKLLADQNGAITRLNVEYETEKKETILNAQKKEIDLHAQNLHLQQLFTRGAFALFVIAAGISLVFFRLYRKNQRISHRNAELVKEQNHRVKNNLQVVSSLLSLQSKRLTDPIAKKAVEESRLRVQSMAILHQRLYDGDKLAEVDLNEFIQEVMRGVLKAYGYSTVTVHTDIDKIILSATKAVPLGLILNELITNACKYAFPDNEAPKLSINCYRTNKKIELSLTDNGPGLDASGFSASKTTKNGSFGMQLIQAQVEQLSGTYQFRSDVNGLPSGVVFTMEFNI